MTNTTRLPAINTKKVESRTAAPQHRTTLRHLYVVNRGNNSRLVLAALKQRPWMAPAPAEGPLRRIGRRRKLFVWDMYRQKKRYSSGNVVCNHLEGNATLVTKKGLYHTMKEYDVPMEEFMPLTFHIPSGKASEEYSEFADFVRAFETGSTLGDETRKPTDATNLWIIKPASFSNRGFGIRVSNSLDEIREMLEGEARRDVRCGGWIVQKYIEEPLLVFGRKFDVRIFVLLVTDRTTGGGVHGYMHTTANYVRTSSTQYSLAASKVTDRLLHLTNDGVQKTSTRYGKYETGNKLTLDALFDHLVNAGRCAPDWLDTYFWPRIRQIVVYTIDASHDKLNPNDRRNSFELLGYDFMLDDHLKIWLIEVNSNPCLDLCCPHLQRELPLLISDTMRVALDYVLPPPDVVTCPQRHAEALEEIRSSAHGFAKVWESRSRRTPS